MNWLKQRRRELNLSQDQLAEKLEAFGIYVTPGAISHWETGRSRPPFDDPKFRQILAHVLQTDVPTILYLAGYEVAQQPNTEQAERAAYIVNQLPPRMQEMAVRILEELAKELTPL